MRQVLAVLLCLTALSACETTDPTTNTTSLPTSPTNPTIETFNGTVQAQGKDIKLFTVSLSGGTLAVTLTTVTPNIQMSLGVGTWDGTTCTLLQSPSLVGAAAAPQLEGQVNLGSYCVVVADALTGAQTGPVTYSVTVAHY